jgi:chorismate mutase
MTTGKDAELRPTIDEVKKAITETIEERLGTVVGLEITVMKLKQVG